MKSDKKWTRERPKTCMFYFVLPAVLTTDLQRVNNLARLEWNQVKASRVKYYLFQIKIPHLHFCSRTFGTYYTSERLIARNANGANSIGIMMRCLALRIYI